MANTGEAPQKTQTPLTAEELERLFPPVIIPDTYVSVPGADPHADAVRYYRGEEPAEKPEERSIYKKLLGKIGLGPS